MIRQLTIVPEQVSGVDLPDGTVGLTCSSSDGKDSVLIVLDKQTAAQIGRQLAGIGIVVPPPTTNPFRRPNGHAA